MSQIAEEIKESVSQLVGVLKKEISHKTAQIYQLEQVLFEQKQAHLADKARLYQVEQELETYRAKERERTTQLRVLK